MHRAFREIWRLVRPPLRLAAGSLLILLGIVGLLLPGMPGWPLIIPGIFLVAPNSRIARWLRVTFRRIKVRVVGRKKARGRSQGPAAPPNQPGE